MKYILVGLLACYVIALVVIQIKAAIIWERMGDSKKRIETMNYKVGDKVRIKSLDWYNENKDEDGNIPLVENTNSKYNFTKRMRGLCGKVMTISSANSYYYDMVEDNGEYFWTDEMIECKVDEETKPNVVEEAKTYWDSIKDAWICPEGYIFKDENGNVINATKIVLEKKKKEYPKTYEECAKVLGTTLIHKVGVIGYKITLLHKLEHLLIARDAYWKLYGEEMGLGKPWEPDWDAKDNHFYTIYTFNGKIECSATAHRNAVLIFPTAEMRDAFYDNFKVLIESCKEYL